MKKYPLLLFGILCITISLSWAQQTVLELDASQSVAKIQPTMYGIFFEDINFGADGGLYSEMVKNRGFEFLEPKMGWLEPKSDRFSLNEKSGISTIMTTSDNAVNRNFNRILVNNSEGYELINEGFRGMGIKEGATYNLSLVAAKHSGNISGIIVQLIDKDGKSLGKTEITPTTTEWKKYSAQITATATEAKARLKITFKGTGTIDLDMISLFPQDTWKNRPGGLRKDLVQLLYDLEPGFLRFPGGCIVEGRTLAQRYQWKKTVGPVENRELLINRWNTEFRHRPTPDYFQTFGVGFFEYFQLSEDLGAEPLPILGCGMACQFNTGELVPLDELGPYVQDAIDLIEFANGPVTSPWGKVRSDMGHPEPFNMKYIGIGNEQWGPEYITRYKIFEKAIKEKYPEITIVSGSGPFPDGEQFEYGMEELKKLDAPIIDEHYYRPPEWFRENATRYDSYDRNGPKIFAGEYAAQSVAIASPDNKNNWNCALSEAAYMTGLERNADVVVMTSYAPLMAHADGWQWTPDMIWFNNLESYGTANYYVQKLYANHPGTDLLSITSDGQAVTGKNKLFASAVKDANKKELIIKVVNTSENSQEISVNLKGVKTESEGTSLTLTSTDLEAVNSVDSPKKISPKEGSFNIKKRVLAETIEPYSFVVFKLKIK
ncbi:MAG: alpha-L-arabinofuranosidase [Bacteroidetes bacterium]|nr:alpha-L-arabinofuranosidase [Bacteroidota bacterium]